MSDKTVLLTKSGYVKLCEGMGVPPHPSVMAYLDGVIDDWGQVEREVAEDRAAGRYDDGGTP